MGNKEEILKKHYWNMCQTDVNKEVIANESPFIYNAMQEYSDQQNKELLDELYNLKIESSHEIADLVKTQQETQAQLGDTFHQLEGSKLHVKQLLARVDELEKGIKSALNLSVLWLPNNITEIQYEGEGQALQNMYNELNQLTSKY